MAYVYLHRRLSDNTPFYVGKGSQRRAWTTTGRNKYWTRVYNKHGLIVEIIFDNLSDDEAYVVEKDCILELNSFGYNLTNLNAGGKGGLNPSSSTRKLMSDAKKGRKPWNFGLELPCIRGLNNPFADRQVYRFEHSSGSTFEGTRTDLCAIFNVSRREIDKLFGTKPRSTALGWKLKE